MTERGVQTIASGDCATTVGADRERQGDTRSRKKRCTRSEAPFRGIPQSHLLWWWILYYRKLTQEVKSAAAAADSFDNI